MTPPQALDLPAGESTDGDGTSNSTDDAESRATGETGSSTDDAESSSVDEKATAVTVLAERGRHVGEREAQRALAELDCSVRERAVVERLAQRLAVGLLAGPTIQVATADDDDVARTALALFEREETHSTT